METTEILEIFVEASESMLVERVVEPLNQVEPADFFAGFFIHLLEGRRVGYNTGAGMES